MKISTYKYCVRSDIFFDLNFISQALHNVLSAVIAQLLRRRTIMGYSTEDIFNICLLENILNDFALNT